MTTYTDMGEIERIRTFDNGQMLLYGTKEGDPIAIDPRPLADELCEAVAELERQS